MNVNITKIMVVLQDGSRHFTAYTDLPARISCDDEVLTLNMFIPGVNVEVIDARTNVKSEKWEPWSK